MKVNYENYCELLIRNNDLKLQLECEKIKNMSKDREIEYLKQRLEKANAEVIGFSKCSSDLAYATGMAEAYREYLEVEKPLNTKYIFKDGTVYRIINTTLHETPDQVARLDVEAVGFSGEKGDK